MRCPTGKGGASIGQDADELQTFGDDPAIARFDFVGKQEEQGWLVPLVSGVHEDGALAEKIGVLL